MLQRIKNFLASLFFLSFFYVFYTQQAYFQGYFSVDHSLTFFSYELFFTTFEVFYFGLIFYSLCLFLLYFFEKNPTTSKSLYAFSALQKMVLSPVSTFEKGLTKEERLGILSILLKGFFIPLMISWLSSHVSNLFSNLTYLIEHYSYLFTDFFGIFQSHLFRTLFQLILFLDVFFFTVAYLVELPILKNQIRSVDPTFAGWVVALACYPPFNGAVGNLIPWQSTDFPFFENPYLFVGLNFLLLILMGIYTRASVALNFKASNLTHRGIISHGPYRFVRHPAYVCKNAAWWIGVLPAFFLAFNESAFEVFLVIFTMSAWTGIYFLRALTEERHLRSVDSQYANYEKKVKWRFIPGLV